MLYKDEFTSPLYQWLFHLSVALFKPFWTCYNNLMSLVITTTLEKKFPGKLFVKRFCLVLPYLVLCIILAPFALVGFILRCCMYMFRNPYRLSIRENVHNQISAIKRAKLGIGNMNICLLPEHLARENNLSDTDFRSTEIGKQIVKDQMFYIRKDEVDVKENIMKTDITTHFPNMDFICIQEVWQSNYSDMLKDELHKIYPYIICDVGIYSRNSNWFCLNSGLMFASKYKILDADFQYFTASCKQCIYSCKGLLMVKVLLWYENVREDKAVVGYIHTTHLQAYQGKVNINCKQLDEIVQWTEEFRAATINDGDVIAFDIVCGDFNFDNISPCDKLAREHNIFNKYKDEGRIRTGEDHEWTVGTEMRQLNIYNDEVSTPEGLKHCLQVPIKRQEYVLDGDVIEASLENLVYRPHKTQLSSVGGKRRIDYILHNKQFSLIPKQYNFVTSLTTLSDHIPVVMQFKLPESLI